MQHNLRKFWGKISYENGDLYLTKNRTPRYKLIKANDKSLNFQILMVFAHINKKSYELENYLTKNSSKEIISYDFLRK